MERITYKGWSFVLSGDLVLQVQFAADGDVWRGRKWRLSKHMTPSEVVQTCLKAVLTAEEHEAREHFLYQGRAIFGPHINIEALWEVCEKKEVRDARTS